MNKIRKFLKRLKLKYYVWSQRTSFSKEIEDSLYEKECFKICLELFKHKDSKFNSSISSGRRYIFNNTLSINITFDGNYIDIKHNDFHFITKMYRRDTERLEYLFELESEKRRLSDEIKIDNEIKTSLKNILQKIKNGGK